LRHMSEQDLRRHLDEAHKQLLERDNAYRFHDEELRRRDIQIEQLHKQLADTQAWAQELEENSREMQLTRAWRFAARLRSLRASARGLMRLGR
jgi:hypothetical protein